MADWKQDSADYSWFAIEPDGCFYRVHRVLVPDPQYPHNFIKAWATAWTESVPVSGLRIGSSTHASADEAKAAMENIMPSDAGAA